MRFSVFALPPLLSAGFSLGLLLYARARGQGTVRGPLSVVLAGLGVWSLGSALEILLDEPGAQIWATKFSYLGVVSVAPALAVAAARGTGRGDWLGPARLGLLALVPLVTLVLALSNELHGWIWSEVRLDTAGPFPALAVRHGPWFWLHWSYSNVCLVAASALLTQHYLRFWGEQRALALAALLGISAPWLANLVYVAGWGPFPHLDLTPFAFTVTGAVLVWIFRRHGAFELVPVARGAVIESMVDGVLVVDGSGHLVDANPAARALVGLSDAWTVGEPLESALGDHTELARALAGREVGRRQISGADADAATRWELVLSTLSDGRGEPCGRVAVIRDVTRQVERDRALIESEARKAAILDASLDMIVGMDDGGRILEFNPAAVAAFGYARRDVIGRPAVQLLVPPRQREGFRAGLAHYLETADSRLLGRRVETRAMRADGSEFPVELAAVASTIGGRPVFTAFLRDLSERKEEEDRRRALELKMQQAQKLESLGVLAGGIAHDFNNLLTAVLGNASLALGEVSPDAAVREPLLQIELASQRAAELCTQMLAYSGRGRLAVERVDLAELVEEMAQLLRASIPKRVQLSLDLAPDLPPLEADPTQLRQVVMNLITNASEAICEEGGSIRVVVGSTLGNRSYLVEHSWSEDLEEGDYLFLEVSDTGCGMDEATRRKIFEPFFTTKFTGRGLGMAAVLGIVRSHRGAIDVASEPGRGSVFRLLLPVGQGRAVEAETEGEPPAESWAGTVLVVDDEPIVRNVVARMLARLGHEVLVASSGGEGVELFTTRRGEIAAAVVDLTMPDIGGEEVLARIRRLEPGLPVVLMSGYTQEEFEAHFAGKERVAFLHKPFRNAELRSALDAAWRAGSEGA